MTKSGANTGSKVFTIRPAELLTQFGAVTGRGSFGRQVLTLMSGTAFAQAIGLAAAPILTRIYTPADFGTYAMYTTLLLIAAPVISTRYEMAIVPAESDDEAFGLLVLSCGIALVAGLLLLVLFSNIRLITALGFLPLVPYAFIGVGGAILNGLYQAFLQFGIRRKQYRQIAGSGLAQSGGAAAIQVSVGAAWSPWPSLLIWGHLFGTVLGILGVSRNFGSAWKEWRSRHKGETIRSLKVLAVRYRRHPIFLPWGGFINALAQRLPVLMISAFYGPYFLGFYALADRLLRIPTTLIGQSCAQVLFQKMTEHHVKKQMPRLIGLWTVGMTLLSIGPFALLFFFSRSIFTFALGKQWAQAGTIAGVLIPVYWGALVVSPISNLLIVANRQALLICIQALILVASFGSIWLGHLLLRDGVEMLQLYAAVQLAVYVIYYIALAITARSMATHKHQMEIECAV